MKSKNGVEKINKLCEEVSALTEDDFRQVEDMAQRQANYINPLKPASSTKYQELGDYNSRVINALKQLHGIIKAG